MLEIERGNGDRHPEDARPGVEAVPSGAGREKQKRWRALRWGCLGLLLIACGGVGVLVAALLSGPVTLEMPGGTQVEVGSQASVLSNFTFQNGTSYYLDVLGNGVRNIVELNYLEDSHSIEVVLHHSTKQERDEQQLLKMKLP
jgi:hypothetical protein